ncbi:uncharacterized protein LTR77_008600 [Saxophila tyrrhenica]|uniref:UFSP1/2/DUB catalytic domain-containing protein n=1 Tax=Saxophila tyrrhenica TaxID=1690608 RepID=A0AAV9P1E0_9PEZI|nr:hypothetical protein LTR77_008600 [Saxophila tyrrhenica]
MTDFNTCPFCQYRGDDTYAIQLHIEERHTEDSPWVVKDDTIPPPKAPLRQAVPSGSSSDSEENPWIKCTRPQCNEYILVADLDDHYEMHQAVDLADAEEAAATKGGKRSAPRQEESHRSPRKHPRSQRPESPRSSHGRNILDYFSGNSSVGRPPPQHRRIKEPREPGRLGRRELGPHAYEKRMPEQVRRSLLRDAEPYESNRIGRDGKLQREMTVDNETRGLIPILADVCALDKSTTASYFCDPSVRHVFKLRCDGNFCGYWNIQMLLSYLYAQQQTSENDRPRSLPNIIEIQETIERAWDNGICTYGRIETGGVLNTRKWIGTHEALAYFTEAGLPVEALAFREDEEPQNKKSTNAQPAVVSLIDHVEAYFISAHEQPGTKHHGTSHITNLPPLYFQRFGHSTTIVGLERKDDGSRNLLVFDPSYATSAAVGRLLAGRNAWAGHDAVLKAYRRSDMSLSRWDEFEIIAPRVDGTKR